MTADPGGNRPTEASRSGPTGNRLWPGTDVAFTYRGTRCEGRVQPYDWWYPGYTFPVRFRWGRYVLVTMLLPSDATVLTLPWERDTENPSTTPATATTSQPDVA
jgi:hypothetical protein